MYLCGLIYLRYSDKCYLWELVVIARKVGWVEVIILKPSTPSHFVLHLLTTQLIILFSKVFFVNHTWLQVAGAMFALVGGGGQNFPIVFKEFR